jgi:hypothetical protein
MYIISAPCKCVESSCPLVSKRAGNICNAQFWPGRIPRDDGKWQLASFTQEPLVSHQKHAQQCSHDDKGKGGKKESLGIGPGCLLAAFAAELLRSSHQ